MYNLDVLLKLKEKNVSLTRYILLKIIEDCSLNLFNDVYLKELVNLKLEGYVYSENTLTPKAKKLLEELQGKSKKASFEELHSKLQNEMLALTGKKQYMVQKKYSFIPNITDLTTKLRQVIVKYKLKDLDKIESLLINHIRKGVKEKFQYIPLILYYISKDGNSSLASDYFNEDSLEQETKVNIEPQEIKSLF